MEGLDNPTPPPKKPRKPRDAKLSKGTVEIIENDVDQERAYDLVININDEWRIIKLDAYQLQIQQYRMPEETPMNKNKERVAKWYAAGYYPTVATAVSSVYNKMLMNKKGQYTLSEFIEEAKKIKASLEDALTYKQ